MMKRCLPSSYIFIGMPRKMKPVASELSGIAVEPDPTTVKGFASVTGTYLSGLAAFGGWRVGRTSVVDRPEPICTLTGLVSGSDMADIFSLMADIWSLDLGV